MLLLTHRLNLAAQTGSALTVGSVLLNLKFMLSSASVSLAVVTQARTQICLAQAQPYALRSSEVYPSTDIHSLQLRTAVFVVQPLHRLLFRADAVHVGTRPSSLMGKPSTVGTGPRVLDVHDGRGRLCFFLGRDLRVLYACPG